MLVDKIIKQAEDDLVLREGEVGWVEMGGPGSGHWRHAGRKGKRGGSVPSRRAGWKPVMDINEAKRWNKESAIKGLLYHGTTPERGMRIKDEGFSLAEATTTTQMPGLFGRGIYLSSTEKQARAYAVVSFETGRYSYLRAMVNVQKVAGKDEFHKVVEEIDYMKKYPTLKSPDIFLRDALVKRGYDAVQYDDEIVVFNPKNIVVVE